MITVSAMIQFTGALLGIKNKCDKCMHDIDAFRIEMLSVTL